MEGSELTETETGKGVALSVFLEMPLTEWKSIAAEEKLKKYLLIRQQSIGIPIHTTDPPFLIALAAIWRLNIQLQWFQEQLRQCCLANAWWSDNFSHCAPCNSTFGLHPDILAAKERVIESLGGSTYPRLAIAFQNCLASRDP